MENKEPQKLLNPANPDWVYYDPCVIAKSQQLLRLLDKRDSLLKQKLHIEMELFNTHHSLEKLKYTDPSEYKWRTQTPNFPNLW